MTHLRKMMLEELQRRHYSEATTRRYIRFIERFAQHFHRSPDRLGPQHIREYQAQLFTVHKLTPGSVTNHLCALRFLYIQTLKRPWSIADTPYPKKRYRLPTILSQEEVTQLIDAAPTPFYRTILMTLYGTGVRHAELTRLKVSDIDSRRMGKSAPVANRFKLKIPTAIRLSCSSLLAIEESQDKGMSQGRYRLLFLVLVILGLWITAWATGVTGRFTSESIRSLLAGKDVISTSDGGGIVRAARVPVCGRERVAKFIATAAHFWNGVKLAWVETNGQAAVLVSRDGVPVALTTIDASAQGIDQIVWILRPSRLAAISRSVQRLSDRYTPGPSSRLAPRFTAEKEITRSFTCS